MRTSRLSSLLERSEELLPLLEEWEEMFLLVDEDEEGDGTFCLLEEGDK